VKQHANTNKKFVRGIGEAPPVDNTADQTKSNNVKSARPYIKKKVFAIYNVDTDESVSSIENFIETSCGVKPVTCFQVKSRDEQSSAFRVCIDCSISEKFLDPSLWANRIIIKPWTFKPKESAHASAPEVRDNAAACSDTGSNK
jgi:DNA-directed RNA polymerase subunit M/transcription elongation factor TFIIS